MSWENTNNFQSTFVSVASVILFSIFPLSWRTEGRGEGGEFTTLSVSQQYSPVIGLDTSIGREKQNLWVKGRGVIFLNPLTLFFIYPLFCGSKKYLIS